MTGWIVADTVSVPLHPATAEDALAQMCAWCEAHCWSEWSYTPIRPDRAFFGFEDADDAAEFMVRS
ncbi:hypothetical protein BV96_02283 [Sphingomonas paucimobilis]|nr:hypothetical protein BV96_02283 [Sphingomonas paucimobilis]